MSRHLVAVALFALAVSFCITVACSGNGGGPVDSGTPDAGMQKQHKKIPTNVDCTKPENCYHLACYGALICGAAPNPGGCPAGEVRSIKNIAGVLTAEVDPDGGGNLAAPAPRTTATGSEGSAATPPSARTASSAAFTTARRSPPRARV